MFNTLLKNLSETDLSRFVITGEFAWPASPKNIVGVGDVLKKTTAIAGLINLGHVDGLVVPKDNKEGIATLIGASPHVICLDVACIDEAITQLHETTGSRRAYYDRQRGLGAGCFEEVLSGGGLERQAKLWTHLYQPLPALIEVYASTNAAQDQTQEAHVGNKWRLGRRNRRAPHALRSSLAFEQQVIQTTRSADVDWKDILVDFKRSLDRVDAKGPRLVMPALTLLSAPGGGKSIVLRWLWRQLWSGELTGPGGRRWRPCYLPLRMLYSRWEAEGRPTLGNVDRALLLVESCTSGAESAKNQTSIERLATVRREYFYLLDGLDETEPRFGPELHNIVKLLVANEIPFVISCRTAAYSAHRDALSQLPVFALGGLSADAQKAYIDHYPGLAEDRRGALLKSMQALPGLAPVANLPIGLALLCWLASISADELPLPATLAQLYERFVERLLTVPRLGSILPTEFPLTAAQRGRLELTALTLFGGMDRYVEFTREAWLAAWGAARGDGEVILQGLLAQGVLVEHSQRDRDTQRVQNWLTFLHLTVHEHLAAAGLARSLDAIGADWSASLNLPVIGFTKARRWLDWASDQPVWQQVLTRLAGLLKNPAPMIKMLSNPKRDGKTMLRRCLAVQCVLEISATSRDESKLSDVIDQAAIEVLKGFGWRADSKNVLRYPEQHEHCIQAWIALSRLGYFDQVWTMAPFKLPPNEFATMFGASFDRGLVPPSPVLVERMLKWLIPKLEAHESLSAYYFYGSEYSTVAEHVLGAISDPILVELIISSLKAHPEFPYLVPKASCVLIKLASRNSNAASLIVEILLGPERQLKLQLLYPFSYRSDPWADLIGNEQLEQSLLKCISDADRELAVRASKVLLVIAPAQHFDAVQSVVLSVLSQIPKEYDDWQRQCDAIELIGDANCELSDDIIAALRHKMQVRRTTATWSIWPCTDRSFPEQQIEPRIRAATLTALAKHQENKSTADLISLALEDSDESVRRSAMTAAKKWGVNLAKYPDLVQKLFEKNGDEDHLSKFTFDVPTRSTAHEALVEWDGFFYAHGLSAIAIAFLLVLIGVVWPASNWGGLFFLLGSVAGMVAFLGTFFLPFSVPVTSKIFETKGAVPMLILASLHGGIAAFDTSGAEGFVAAGLAHSIVGLGLISGMNWARYAWKVIVAAYLLMGACGTAMAIRYGEPLLIWGSTALVTGLFAYGLFHAVARLGNARRLTARLSEPNAFLSYA